MKKSILATCASIIASSASVPYGLQIDARQELARRSTTTKVKGPNATKGKRHASLKSRSNKRK